MPAKKEVLPLKRVLDALDRNDSDFYSSLNEEEQKAFSPWLIMRCASASVDYPEHYLVMVNDLVNVNFDVISKHPDLFWRLISLSGVGKPTYHPFIRPPKKAGKTPLETAILELNRHFNEEELALFLKMNDNTDLGIILGDAGYDTKEIKKLLK